MLNEMARVGEARSMGLTTEEMEQLRRQHLEDLEAREGARARERALKAAQQATQELQAADPVAAEREDQIRRLKERVEEEFYRERGYRRYVDHRGRVVWLTPEEYAFRLERRKKNRHKHGDNPQLKKRIQLIALYVAIIALAVAAGSFLVR